MRRVPALRRDPSSALDAASSPGRGRGRVALRRLVVLAVLLAGVLAVAAGPAGVVAADQSPDRATSTGSSSSAAALSGSASPVGIGESSSAADVAPTSGSATSAAQSASSIVETATYRRVSGQPDRVEVTIAYEVPEDVTRLTFGIAGDRYEVVDATNFQRTDAGTFRWTGDGTGGSVTIRHDVSESFRAEAPDEQYVGGAEDWAIVARPPTTTEWASYSGLEGVEYRLAVDGEGHAGQRLAYLGRHEVVRDSAAGEEIALVVPAAAETESSPDQILESVRYASEHLRVGGRSDEVTLFVAPTTGAVDWSPPGLALGSDARVVDTARVDSNVNVWVHEYVHTRQNRDNPDPAESAYAPDFRWFVEGSADYYAALFALERGTIDFATFRQVLERGTRGNAADAVLAEPSSWEGTDANYEKGALVAGAIDRELRAASDGEHGLQAVLEAWNRDETYSGDDLEALAADLGGDSTREFVRRHTRTDAVPSTWGRDAHSELFDAEVPTFDARVVSEPPVSTTGPYREGGLPQPLVTGEWLSTEVRVENVGDVAGGFRVVLSLGGREAAAESGDLEPGESTTVTLAHRLDRTGRLRLVVGDHSDRISVKEPAEPQVTEFTVASGSPVVGQPTRVDATVRNPTNRPADGEVEVLVDGERAAATNVTLPANGTTTVELSATFDAAGERVVSMGGGELTVNAREPNVLDRAQQLPGFGAGAALLGLVVAVALLARRT